MSSDHDPDVAAVLAAAPYICVHGHEHGVKAEAESCDAAWDQSWRGSVCGLHDAGLPMLCSCTPTRRNPTNE